MKIGIYHPFNDLPDNYSLSHVVYEQFLMLTEAGIDTYFITLDSFNGEVPEGVTLCNVLPRGKSKEIEESADRIMENLTHCFTHDVVYLNAYKEHDKAIRRWAEKYPDLKWLHWSHSAPNPADPKTPIPNSIYIGLNNWDLPRLAEQFKVPEAQCRLVYNSVSPDIFNHWHPFTKMLVDKHSLLDCEILMIFPLDTGRWDSKGGPKVIKLVQKLRDRKLNAKVVFVNAAANDKGRRKMVEGLQKKHGEYVIFTSLEDKRYEVYTPRKVVEELMDVGNVFPLLSRSEGCSLTLLEAAIKGMMVILNRSFPPFHEFGRTDLVFWMDVGSDRATVNHHPNEDQYYKEQAQNFQAFYEQHASLRLKNRVLKRFNRGFIWEQQLKLLLQ